MSSASGVLMDKSRDYRSILCICNFWITFVRPTSIVGVVHLCQDCTELCKDTPREVKQIAGPLFQVQLSAFSRFPYMTPKMKSTQENVHSPPLLPSPFGVRYVNILSSMCQCYYCIIVLFHVLDIEPHIITLYIRAFQFFS